eukprot:RCo006921
MTSKPGKASYAPTKAALDADGAREKWKTIENAIQQIYQQNASSLSFQNLYTSGYQIILHKHGEILYTGVEATMTAHVIRERERANAQPDGTFLQELLSCWEKHRTAVSMIRDILMYMDKNYVPHVAPKKLGVYDLGVKIFGECMLKEPRSRERIRTLTLQIIQAERNGESAPQRLLLKSLTKMMTEVGKRDVYEPCLEEPFLRDSSDYYKVEAQNYFAGSTTPDYIRKVFKRLEEERDRVDRCLDETTKPKIEAVIKREMLVSYKQQIIEKENSGCVSLLTDWKVADLRLLYECMALIDDIPAIVTVIKEHLLTTGTRFVMDQENTAQPLTLVEGMLDLRARYAELLRLSFYTMEGEAVGVAGPRATPDRSFEQAFHKAFEEIANKNPRFAEYLSLYVDSKMCRGKAQVLDQEFDVIFDNVLGLFRYLRDKDIFEKYYKTHLARRLLGQKSTSEDAERGFIAKLKTAYGCQFTSKLEGMFQDMKLSQDTTEAYRQHLVAVDKRLPCDLVATVLTTTYWPVSKTNDVVLPPEVQAAANDFKHYYLGLHSGRKLHYQYNMGNADVRLRLGGKTYELNMGTHQMAVMVCFNVRDTLTFMELGTLTNILPADLKRCLTSLCHTPPKQPYTPLLLRGGGSAEGSSSSPAAAPPAAAAPIEAETRFTFNEDFRSKLVRVKILQAVQRETEDEARGTRARVDEERKWQLEAVIVRVMKSRRVLEHRSLVVEVTRLLTGRFTPSPDDIKKRIESLIEREYLERSAESRSKYNYLA